MGLDCFSSSEGAAFVEDDNNDASVLPLPSIEGGEGGGWVGVTEVILVALAVEVLLELFRTGTSNVAVLVLTASVAYFRLGASNNSGPNGGSEELLSEGSHIESFGDDSGKVSEASAGGFEGAEPRSPGG